MLFWFSCRKLRKEDEKKNGRHMLFFMYFITHIRIVLDIMHPKTVLCLIKNPTLVFPSENSGIEDFPYYSHNLFLKKPQKGFRCSFINTQTT